MLRGSGEDDLRGTSKCSGSLCPSCSSWVSVCWCHLMAPLEEPSGQGLASRTHPTPQPGAGQLGGTRAAPAPGIGHLSGDGPRLDQDMVPAQWHPWVGKGGLWGAGEQPCCDTTGAGPNDLWGLTRGPGPWAEWGEPWGWGELSRSNQVWECPQGLGLSCVRWPLRACIPCSLQPERNQFMCSQRSL